MASTSGCGFITMPGPPPYGASSTERCRSLVKSRGLTKSTVMRPAARALPSRLAASADSNASGNSVTTVMRMSARLVLGQVGRRVDHDAAALDVDVEQELVHHRQEALDLALPDDQAILGAELEA